MALPVAFPRSLSGFAQPARAAIAIALVVGCGQLTSKNSLSDPGNGQTKNLGCIQGVIVNGLTGDAVDLTTQDLANGNGLRVLVGADQLQPVAADHTSVDLAGLNGHYSLCSLPLDETYPLQLNLPGYQKVEGLVKVASTTSSQSAKATADINKLVPTSIVNIYVYPVGAKTNDLKFLVTHNGQPVVGAPVILLANGSNDLVVDKLDFLIPQALSPTPLTGLTDATGTAVFPGAALVLGAGMHYRVMPPAGALANLTVAEDNFNVGIVPPPPSSGPALVQLPYQINVELKNQLVAFSITPISTSFSDGDYTGDAGDVWLVFNRDIEIVPGTEDGIVATLVNNDTAELVADVPGNGQSEQVNLHLPIVGNKLHLSPNFKIPPNKKTDGGMTVTFSGIKLRPVGSPGTANQQSLVLAPVPVFGGVTPVQVVTSVVLAPGSSAALSAAAKTDIPQTIAVKVLDQFGNSYKQSTPVTFAVQNTGATANPGSVRAVGSSDASSPVLVVNSDPATGLAQATWRLGDVTGTQTLTVTTGPATVQPVLISATALAVPTQLLALSNQTLSANAGAELADPVQVRVLDQSGLPITSAVSVHFRAVAGLVRSASDQNRKTDIDVVSDANGIASVYWTLGNASGAQSLLASVGSLQAQPVTATALQVPTTITNLSSTPVDNGAQWGTSVELDVKLMDLAHVLCASSTQPVSFQLTPGVGTLSADSAASAPTTDVNSFNVNAVNGEAKAKVWLNAGASGTAFTVTASAGGVQQTVIVSGTVGVVAHALNPVAAPASGAKGTDLTYSVQLLDQEGQALKMAGQTIAFHVATGAGTLRLTTDSSVADGKPDQAVVTDANGIAAVVFNILADGAFQISASAPAFAGVQAVILSGTGAN